MFWNKKDDKKSLPDLPPIKSPFSKDLALSSENTNVVSEKMEEEEEEPAEEDEVVEKQEDKPVKKREKHALPSFPDSPTKKGFSQTAIKAAVAQEDLKEPAERIVTSDDEPEQITKKATIPMEENHISTKANPYLTSMSSPMPETTFTQQTTAYNSPNDPEASFPIGLPPSESEEIESDEDLRPPKSPDSSQKGDVFVKIEKFYSAKKSLDAIKQQIDQIDDLLKKIRDIKMKEERELAVWEKEIALVKSRIQNVNETIFEKISQ